MKKILLSFVAIAFGFSIQAQVTCAGISPASVAGNYNFEWAPPPNWGTPDFLIPGTFVQAELAMAEDGTAGTTTYGHPASQQACFALDNMISDVTGKIAVLYRGDCEFGVKALNAQNAGAVAVLMINHTGDAVGMGAGQEGLNVTIPVVMVSELDGADIVSEMLLGPVVFFLGNKVGAYPNDVGASFSETRISSYGTASTLLDNGFEIAIQLYNFGANPQSNLTVNASIDGPSGNVYSETINAPTMNTGDTLSIAAGNTYFFSDFDLGGIGNYPTGDYTLTYTLDMGVPDDSDFDNILTADFSIGTDMISLAGTDASGDLIATTYPSNSTIEYQSCMFFEDPNASNLGLMGFTFVPTVDTTVTPLAGEEIYLNIYMWDDPWIDLADPAYAGAANNDWFTALTQVAFESYYPVSNSEVNQNAYIPLTTPMALADNQRYLFCIQSYNPEIGFGYDGNLNYDGNQAWSAMPESPVYVDDTWYTGGWVGPSAVALGMHVIDAALLGLDEVVAIDGKAFPNPANDRVTISINTTGNASLIVTDVSGKIALNEEISLDNNGNAQININALEPGVYVFNVALENGLSSQFNVIKQ